MSTSIRTRDGSYSAAQALLAHNHPGEVPVSLDLPGILEWGKLNKVAIRGKRAVETINARRIELDLPPFQVDPRKRGSVVADTGAGKPDAKRQPAGAIAASEDDLLNLVTGHSGTKTGLVTPDIARWLLELNTGNRPLQKHNCERFRTILQAGQWQNTGEPVIVSREGVLNDGQHRLKAIVDTKISVIMDVRFGIAREAFHATGTGKRRSPSNVLSIEGYSNASCQAAIARLVRHYDAGQMGQFRQQVESTEIVSIVEAQEMVGHVAATIARFRFAPTRTGPFGFVLVIASRTTAIDRVLAFANIAASGMAQSEGDPARRLHVRLRDMAIRKERLHQIDVAALTAKAWNAWILGEELPQLRVTDSDRTSAGFPQIATANPS